MGMSTPGGDNSLVRVERTRKLSISRVNQKILPNGREEAISVMSEVRALESRWISNNEMRYYERYRTTDARAIIYIQIHHKLIATALLRAIVSLWKTKKIGDFFDINQNS